MNYVEKISTKWNIMDSFFSVMENNAAKLISEIRESKEELPDPEEMIEAETKYLRAENEKLKALQFPKK